MMRIVSRSNLVIDPFDPDLKTLKEIGIGLSGRPGEMTLWRCMSKGINGILLPVIRIAHKPDTTPEAVRVFLNETRAA
ncbi:hypothetical protein CA54_40530 [Symmachiella macrocystis]|uniref:Uncharacterized protein n=1 Tax=Symmachiella macrocystis TaxID=2527985 RepID=A0A5C6BC06_9PLAN|nr:hypothetical protein [Symmachiella macrocystis]TWU08816.1 hypothetical protein CA54_40530 [Symmachiella macrocystis]